MNIEQGILNVEVASNLPLATTWALGNLEIGHAFRWASDQFGCSWKYPRKTERQGCIRPELAYHRL